MRYFSSYERLILKQFSNEEELKRTKVTSMSEQTAIFFGGGGGWGGREVEVFLPEKTFYQDKRMSLQLEMWERAEKLLMKSKG